MSEAHSINDTPATAAQAARAERRGMLHAEHLKALFAR